MENDSTLDQMTAAAELFSKLVIIKNRKPIQKGSDVIMLEYAHRKLSKDISKRTVRRFLAEHCNRYMYLKTLSEGGKRYNPVTGEPAEHGVTPEEAEHAKQQYEKMKAARKARERAEKKAEKAASAPK